MKMGRGKRAHDFVLILLLPSFFRRVDVRNNFTAECGLRPDIINIPNLLFMPAVATKDSHSRHHSGIINLLKYWPHFFEVRKLDDMVVLLILSRLWAVQ